MIDRCNALDSILLKALMTGSWDKTVKFWDTRSPNPIMSIDMGERVYAADVDYPMAVVGTAGRGLRIYNLENQPKEFKRVESPLKYQHRCISIFKDKSRPTPQPTGTNTKALVAQRPIKLLFLKTTHLYCYRFCSW